MSTVEQIAEAISTLTLAEKIELHKLLGVQAQDDEWDRQMKADAQAGRLDRLIAEADREIDEGRTLPGP